MLSANWSKFDSALFPDSRTRFQGEEALTFAVVAESHLGLAKTNCVLSGTDAVKRLELGLLDILFFHEEMSARGQIQNMASNWGSCVEAEQDRQCDIGGAGRGANAYLAGEVDLNGLDADVLGTRSHVGS